MKSADLYKHVPSEVVERIELEFQNSDLLVGVLNNMVESQYMEASAQVGKQLVDRMAAFKSFLGDLRSQAEAYEKEQASKDAEPVTKTSEPATVQSEAAAVPAEQPAV